MSPTHEEIHRLAFWEPKTGIRRETLRAVKA